jgi:hypothetical protein
MSSTTQRKYTKSRVFEMLCKQSRFYGESSPVLLLLEWTSTPCIRHSLRQNFKLAIPTSNLLPQASGKPEVSMKKSRQPEIVQILATLCRRL